MPSTSSALITYMKTFAVITDIVGAGTAARIHKMTIPEGTQLPYLRLEVFEGADENWLGGSSGLARNVVQIDAYDDSSDGAWDLAEAVRLSINNKSGTLGSLEFEEILTDGTAREDEDRPPKGSNQRRFFVTRDYNVVFHEPTS